MVAIDHQYQPEELWPSDIGAIMELEAIKQASLKLDHADEVLHQLCAATEEKPYRARWFDFLNATYAIYEKLKKGALEQPEAQKWIDDEIELREADPLLLWFQHARNAEFHALGSSLEFVPGVKTVTTRVGDETRIVKRYRPVPYGFEEQIVEEWTNKSPDLIQIQPATMRAVAVYKGKLKTEAPTTHLGKPLADLHPTRMAEHAFRHHKSLVWRASSHTPFTAP